MGVAAKLREKSGERDTRTSDLATPMDLDRRKRQILQFIVESYVERAEPVGSHLLAGQPSLGVRSATIRNELAEMTDMGYLRQPHTSAGRIPSDQGYRYYVDHLMTWERLSPADARTLRPQQRWTDGELEQLLIQTCRALSMLTHYTTVAAPPTSQEVTLRQIHLVQMTGRRVLVVIVLDNGQVVHRHAELRQTLNPGEVTLLTNALDRALRGESISRVSLVTFSDDQLRPYQELLTELVGVINRGLSQHEEEMVLEGASRMLEQPEFRDSNRVEPLVRFLEARRTAVETLQRLLAVSSLCVSIGEENPHAAMHEVSLVAARYQAPMGRSGWIGVLGPTRMHYTQAVPAVRYAAQVLTDALARLADE